MALSDDATNYRTTFITGPAGIGKSRLVSEAMSLSQKLNRTVLTGGCTLEQSVPFEPFVTAVRRRIRTLTTDDIATLFSGGASLAAAIVPEAARIIGLPTEAPSQPDLFAGIWQLLFRLAGDRGSTMVIEDLHWADSDTLRLLDYLVRESDELRTWIVATYRADEITRRHALHDVILDLRRERRFDEISLSALDHGEIAEMIQAILNTTRLPERLLELVEERTSGNPFFIEEFVKELFERGVLSQSGDEWMLNDGSVGIPRTISEALLARARGLGAEAMDVLHLAAIGGDTLESEILSRASGHSLDVVEAVIAEAISMQLLIENVDHGRVRYSFRHALSREALSDELVGPQRRRAHLNMAKALESLGHRDPRTLADHYREGGDREAAKTWTLEAARAATQVFAVDEAARRYEQLLGLLDHDDSGRSAVLQEAIEATTDFWSPHATTDTRLSVAFADEAVALGRESGDRALETKGLDALALNFEREGDTPQAVQLLTRAAEVIRGHDDDLEAVTLARLVSGLARIDQMAALAEMLPEAKNVANRAENHRALSRFAVIEMMTDPLEFFVEHFTRARDEAEFSGSERALHALHQTAGFVTLWTGQFARSQESFERAIDIGNRIAPHDTYTAAGYAWLLSLLGRYEELPALVDRINGFGAVPSRIVALTGLCESDARRADPVLAEHLDELRDLVERTGESQRSVPYLAARARYVVAQHGSSAAASMFWTTLEASVAARGRGSHWPFSPDFAMALLADDAVVELRRWSDAVAEITRADSHQHNEAAGALVAACAEGAAGNIEVARTNLARAEALYSAMPCPARVAETHLASALIESRAGQYELAQRSALAARDVAQSIGAVDLVTRATLAFNQSSVPTTVATILFSDVVDSTQTVQGQGDAAWRAVLDRHDDAFLRSVTANGGRVVNTTGDGIVAAFDSPARALRCADEVRRFVGEIGLAVRFGVHTGECHVVGTDLRGIAVHLAARVCQSAHAGQVAVTSTVRELVAGSGLQFDETGPTALKGFEDPVRLFSLRPL